MSSNIVRPAVKIQKYAPTQAMVAPVDPVLTTFAVSHAERDNTYLVSKVGNAGVLKSDTKNGTYFVHSEADWNRLRAGKVGHKGPVPNIEHGGTWNTYDCNIWGAECPTPQTIIDIAAKQGMNLEEDDATFVADAMLLAMERDLIATVDTATPNSSTWGTSWAGAAADAFVSSQAKYFDTAGSKPVEVLARMAKGVIRKAGKRPNFMFMGSNVDVALQSNADLIDRHPGAVQVNLMEADYAKLFRIPNVIIVDSVYNSAAEGGTTTIADNFSNSIWLGYIETNMRPKSKSAIARIDWTGMTDSVEGLAVMRFAGAAGSDNDRCMVTRALRAWQYVYPDLNAGAYLSACLSA